MKKRRLKRYLFMVLTAALTAGCGQGEKPQNNEESRQEAEEKAVDAKSDDTQTDESLTEESFGEQADETDYTQLSVCQTRHIYGGILSGLTAAYELPDMELDRQSLYDRIFSMSDNRFAVGDVDGDGREELIISYTTASMAGMFEIVYGYNPDTMDLTCELLTSPDVTYYDNGIVKVLASHNHTLSMDFWPYTLYQYNARTDQYDYLADVRAWDKTYGDVSYAGNRFPEEEDLDGDGILYEIQTDITLGSEAVRYDGDEFQTWISRYLDGAQEIQINYQPVVSENFQDFTTDFLTLLHDMADEQRQVSHTDIGWLYIRSSLEEAQQYLSESYGVQWEENPEFEYEYTGSYEGKEIFSLIYMNSGVLSYKDSQVDEVTVFGIYPGMDENTAVATLMSYGFYPEGNLENYMITGDGLGNAAVSYKISDGVITDLGVSAYCAYVG